MSKVSKINKLISGLETVISEVEKCDPTISFHMNHVNSCVLGKTVFKKEDNWLNGEQVFRLFGIPRKEWNSDALTMHKYRDDPTQLIVMQLFCGGTGNPVLSQGEWLKTANQALQALKLHRKLAKKEAKLTKKFEKVFLQ